MSKANTIAVYPGDRLTLTRDLETELLVVHLGTPPAVLELAGFTLSCDEREFLGFGSFEIRSQGELVEIHQSLPEVQANYIKPPLRHDGGGWTLDD